MAGQRLMTLHNLDDFRRTPAQPRAVAKAERILAATRIVAQREGRDLFTTSQVAAEAGISIGGVYRYAADRRELLRLAFPNLVDGFGDLPELPASCVCRKRGDRLPCICGAQSAAG